MLCFETANTKDTRMTPFNDKDQMFLDIAYQEAKKGYEEGGVPVSYNFV